VYVIDGEIRRGMMNEMVKDIKGIYIRNMEEMLH
jgi:hypothetical protein